MQLAASSCVTCSSKGGRLASCGGDPVSTLTLTSCSSQREELTIRVRHNAKGSVHTAGHIWSASRQLAQWLVAQSSLVRGSAVLELGSGLGLPSLVAAKLGSVVTATDELEPILDYLKINSELNGCALRVQRCDVTRRADVCRLLDEAADGVAGQLVLFSDIVYGGDMGEALPYALAELLIAHGPAAMAVGVFPSQIRAGVPRFWEHAAAVLEWVGEDGCDEDPRRGSLYTFRARPDAAAALAASSWVQNAHHEGVEDSGLEPLF